MAYQLGGWYNNPEQGGKNMRYWAPGVWTMGEEPTGDWKNTTQAPQSQPVTQNTTQSGLANDYLDLMKGAQSSYDKILNDYLGANAEYAGFGQKLNDAVKQAGQYPSASQYRQEYSQNPNLTPMAIEALVSNRVNTTGGTIQDIINRATSGVQQDLAGRQQAVTMAQQPLNNLLQQYQLAQTSLPSSSTSGLQFMNIDGVGYAIDPQTGQLVNTFGGGGGGTGGGKSLYDIMDEINAEMGGFDTTQVEQMNTTPGQMYSPLIDPQTGRNNAMTTASPYLDYFTSNMA